MTTPSDTSSNTQQSKEPITQAGTNSELKEQLFGFWQDAEEYYALAREYNLHMTPERERMLSFIPENSQVLDVGCGAGENGLHISKKANYTGLEYSETALKMAKDFESDTCHFLQGDAEHLPFEDNHFDVSLSTHVIEHLTNPKRVIDEQLRVIKPGGLLMIMGPAWEVPWEHPPSCDIRAKNPLWRIQWTIKRAIKLLSNDTDFDMILDPDILDGKYEEDNDTVYAVSVRRLVNYLTSVKGLKVEFVQDYNTVKDEWGHHGPQAWLWQMMIKLPIFNYANACMFIVVRKPE